MTGPAVSRRRMLHRGDHAVDRECRCRSRECDGGEAVAAVMGMALRLWVLLLCGLFGRYIPPSAGEPFSRREVLSLDLACS